MIKLFENKSDCCACGACVSVCPKSAISLKNDEYGFVYPEIDSALCVECGRCKKVCSFQNKATENMSVEAYAAAVNDDDKIMRSTSGGTFAVLAEEMLRRGGVVFGSALEMENNCFNVHHIAVENIKDLPKILKSKYVQSATEDCYIKAKQYLDNGRCVLYSGTPCQIAGLKGYLGKKYDNLLTVDLVCHGVPSLQLFRCYITQIEKRENIKITDFQFRDKEKGLDFFNKLDFTDKNGENKSISYNNKSVNFSYTDSFLKLENLRENCYTCKYACANRPADITIGDYWGINKVHDEWLKQNGGKLNHDKGISCVILNTQKGIDCFDTVKQHMITYKSNFEEVSQYNAQLKAPSVLSPTREKILEGFKNNGYEYIENSYIKYLSKEKAKAKIKKLVPTKIWDKAKEIIKGN